MVLIGLFLCPNSGADWLCVQTVVLIGLFLCPNSGADWFVFMSSGADWFVFMSKQWC